MPVSIRVDWSTRLPVYTSAKFESPQKLESSKNRFPAGGRNAWIMDMTSAGATSHTARASAPRIRSASRRRSHDSRFTSCRDRNLCEINAAIRGLDDRKFATDLAGPRRPLIHNSIRKPYSVPNTLSAKYLAFSPRFLKTGTLSYTRSMSLKLPVVRPSAAWP